MRSLFFQIFVHNPHNRSVLYDTAAPSTTTDGSQSGPGRLSSASGAGDLNFLNFNQTITYLAAGPISSSTVTGSETAVVDSAGGGGAGGTDKRKSGSRKVSMKRQQSQQQLNHDILMVGTKSSVHAYDILHNTDLYYKEVR